MKVIHEWSRLTSTSLQGLKSKSSCSICSFLTVTINELDVKRSFPDNCHILIFSELSYEVKPVKPTEFFSEKSKIAVISPLLFPDMKVFPLRRFFSRPLFISVTVVVVALTDTKRSFLSSLVVGT